MTAKGDISMDIVISSDSTLEFKDRLKLLREEKGIKQYQLAKYVGVCRATVSGYETKGYQPSHEKLQRMAQVFDVSIDYLVGGGPEDEELQINVQSTHKRLVKEIARSSTNLSYEDKLKLLDYIRFLEYQNSIEEL